MLVKLERHVLRPAHLHIRINVREPVCHFPVYTLTIPQAPGYEELTTALYFKGDPYLTSDAVFGVKSSLIVVR